MNSSRPLTLVLALVLVAASLAAAPANEVASPVHTPSHNSWPTLPGFTPHSPITLTSYETFAAVVAASALSFILSEFVLGDFSDNEFFLQVRAGMNDGLRADESVALINVGLEARFSPWYAVALELTYQHWQDGSAADTGIGGGVMTYHRWYLSQQQPLRLYIEYGTGLFFSGTKFPADGTQFTFNHSSQLGLEYTFENNNKIRIGYGQFHQSNGGLASPNPGYDANGFSVTIAYLWTNLGIKEPAAPNTKANTKTNSEPNIPTNTEGNSTGDT